MTGILKIVNLDSNQYRKLFTFSAALISIAKLESQGHRVSHVCDKSGRAPISTRLEPFQPSRSHKKPTSEIPLPASSACCAPRPSRLTRRARELPNRTFSGSPRRITGRTWTVTRHLRHDAECGRARGARDALFTRLVVRAGRARPRGRRSSPACFPRAPAQSTCAAWSRHRRGKRCIRNCCAQLDGVNARA